MDACMVVVVVVVVLGDLWYLIPLVYNTRV